MAKATELFKALHVELAALLTPVPIVRRYMPLNDLNGLTGTQISLWLDNSAPESLARGFSQLNVTFGLSVQRQIEGNTVADANAEPVLDGVDDRAACDAVIDTVEAIKLFWLDDEATGVAGPLKDKEIAGFSFAELIQDNLYEPFHMIRFGLMTSLIEVRYVRTQ